MILAVKVWLVFDKLFYIKWMIKYDSQCVNAYFGPPVVKIWTRSFGGQNLCRTLALISLLEGCTPKFNVYKHTQFLWLVINVHIWIKCDKTIEIWLWKECLYIYPDFIIDDKHGSQSLLSNVWRSSQNKVTWPASHHLLFPKIFCN